MSCTNTSWDGGTDPGEEARPFRGRGGKLAVPRTQSSKSPHGELVKSEGFFEGARDVEEIGFLTLFLYHNTTFADGDGAKNRRGPEGGERKPCRFSALAVTTQHCLAFELTNLF